MGGSDISFFFLNLLLRKFMDSKRVTMFFYMQYFDVTEIYKIDAFSLPEI